MCRYRITTFSRWVFNIHSYAYSAKEPFVAAALCNSSICWDADAVYTTISREAYLVAVSGFQLLDSEM